MQRGFSKITFRTAAKFDFSDFWSPPELPLELAPLLEAQAKERQRAGGGDQKSAKAKSTNSSEPMAPPWPPSLNAIRRFGPVDPEIDHLQKSRGAT